MLTHWEMLTRITVGALLGACIGYERARHGRPLGLRTHIIVALAAATFMVLSSQFAFYQGYPHDSKLVEVDSSRIAASVVSAVGFIAGGSILRTGISVQGLTTAAALWLATAIGMCSGGGMYIEAVFSTALGLVTLVVVRRFEDKSHFVARGRFVVDPRQALADVVQVLERQGAVVTAIEGSTDLTVRFELKHAARLGLVGIVHTLEGQPSVRGVCVERMDY
ncbi:MAG TPA: MgtC/SapB family protein [Polyangiales bacterium]|nr:MgtC/SapB family protein [Polyangiales bacterium]